MSRTSSTHGEVGATNTSSGPHSPTQQAQFSHQQQQHLHFQQIPHQHQQFSQPMDVAQHPSVVHHGARHLRMAPSQLAFHTNSNSPLNSMMAGNNSITHITGLQHQNLAAPIHHHTNTFTLHTNTTTTNMYQNALVTNSFPAQPVNTFLHTSAALPNLQQSPNLQQQESHNFFFQNDQHHHLHLPREPVSLFAQNITTVQPPELYVNHPSNSQNVNYVNTQPSFGYSTTSAGKNGPVIALGLAAAAGTSQPHQAGSGTPNSMMSAPLLQPVGITGGSYSEGQGPSTPTLSLVDPRLPAPPTPMGAALPPPPSYTPSPASAEFDADKYIQYKTFPCRAFEMGQRCTFGQGCLFAHGASELRTIEQNVTEGIRSHKDVLMLRARLAEAQLRRNSGSTTGSAAPLVYVMSSSSTTLKAQTLATANSSITSTVPAPLHIELNTAADTGVATQPLDGAGKSSDDDSSAKTRNATVMTGGEEMNKFLLFKTSVCRSGAVCPYANDCVFAHNESELRTVEMNVADRLFSEKDLFYFQVAKRQKDKAAQSKQPPPPPPPPEFIPTSQSTSLVSPMMGSSQMPTMMAMAQHQSSLPSTEAHKSYSLGSPSTAHSMPTGSPNALYSAPFAGGLSQFGSSSAAASATLGIPFQPFAGNTPNTLSAASAVGGQSNQYCSSSAPSSHHGQLGNSGRFAHSASGSVTTIPMHASNLVSYFDPALPNVVATHPSPSTPLQMSENSRSNMPFMYQQATQHLNVSGLTAMNNNNNNNNNVSNTINRSQASFNLTTTTTTTPNNPLGTDLGLGWRHPSASAYQHQQQLHHQQPMTLPPGDLHQPSRLATHPQTFPEQTAFLMAAVPAPDRHVLSPTARISNEQPFMTIHHPAFHPSQQAHEHRHHYATPLSRTNNDHHTHQFIPHQAPGGATNTAPQTHAAIYASLWQKQNGELANNSDHQFLAGQPHQQLQQYQQPLHGSLPR